MALYHYVTQEQLSGFDKYKYSAVDSNPLSIYVMHPFWNSVVKILPTWLAPNLITFTGFMFLVLTFTLLSFFDFDFYASGEVNKLCVYDCYGSDVLLMRGEYYKFDFFFIYIYILYSIYTYHTQYIETSFVLMFLFLSLYQTISVVYIITAVVGVEAWYKPVIGIVQYRDLFTVMIVGCLFVVTLPMSLYNVFKAYRNSTLKHSSVYEALLPFFSPVLLFVLSTLWISLSPTDIIEKQPRIFYLMVGTAFSNVTCKLIVCQMSNTRCKPLSLLLLPMTAVVLLVISGVVQHGEITVLYIWTAIVILTHIHYGVSVVSKDTHTQTAN
uniref:Selenoprotein I n=1 Tax=Cyprinus carpio TaxID=7962 RepID=A0A8C1WJ56_CYPCA